MAGKSRTSLELRVGSLAESDLRVSRIRGREALSEPYLFEVDFESHGDDPLALDDLVGAEAQVSLKRADGPERLLHGVADAVSITGMRARRPLYRLRLVPRLALLAHGEDSRIFQNLSVPEIVKKVLDEGKVKHAFGEKRQAAPGGLAATYPKREYCVQYRESDLAFVSRLLEEEGIFYLFDHADGDHTLVLGDAPGALQAIAGDAALPFGEPEAARQSDLEHVHGITREDRLLTAKATLRDFDFERPDLQIEDPAQPPKDGELEDYRYRLRYADPGPLKRLSKSLLEELRDAADAVEGRSNCLRLAPGCTFEVTGAPAGHLGGKLQLLWVGSDAVWDAGADSAGYECRFLAQQAGAAWRPPRRTPRPLIPGTQTATVVGAAGEEIDTDKHGRVKLLFHWDRQGKKDDKASCFVRVGQPWAGPGWGAVHLPRIGQEALVRFLEGDPDRPLVAGAVYDGSNPPPVPLPDEKTKSTLRSESSLGGGGNNELLFEDAKDAEEVFLHGQKDEHILVENDKRQEVGGDESLEVGKDRSRTVSGNQTLTVGGNDATQVDGRQTVTVLASRTTAVSGGHEESVSRAQVVTVSRTRDEQVALAAAYTVGAAAALTVGGGLAVTAGGAMNKAVGGLFSGQVGGARVEVTGKTREESVRKNSSARVGGDFESSVSENVEADVGKDLSDDVSGDSKSTVTLGTSWIAKAFELGADKLTIEVGGKKAVVLEKSGDVKIAASKVSFEASGALTFKGSKVEKSSGSSTGGAAKKAPAPEKELTCRFGADEARCGDEVELQAAGKNIPDGEVSFKLDAKPKGGSLGTVKGKLQKSKGTAKWVAKKPKGAKEVEAEASAGGKKAKSKAMKLHAYPDVAAETKTIACRSGRFGWTGKFAAEFKDGTLHITTRVKLLTRAGDKPDDTSGVLPAAGTADAATKATMKADIEAKLTDKWLLHRKNCKRGARCDCPVDAACCKIPVKIAVEFVESSQHHDVNLWSGRGRANSGNFTLQKTRDNSWAHETGHLLGWYDEYATGAVGAAPRWIASNPGAVMNTGLTVPATYYWDFRDWLAAKAGEEWELIAK